MYKTVLYRFVFSLFVSFWAGIALAQPMVTADYTLNVEIRDDQGVPVKYGFNVAALERLPRHVIETNTIWTEGVQVFEGVLLKDFLAHIGVSEGNIEASATNEYLIDINVNEATDIAPLIAYKRNGEYMSLRDKGPLWVVFPYDASEEFRRDEIYAQSIWQVDSFLIE